MRVIICGGRDYKDRNGLFLKLATFHAETPITELIHGDATGADSLAEAWASHCRITITRFPADWKQHGLAAGPIRNQRMVDEGKPDAVIAFPGGKGTADMIRRAEAAGIPVYRL